MNKIKKVIISTLLLCVFMSCGKNSGNDNNDLTKVSKQIRNDLMSIYFKDIDSGNYNKPKITENDSEINVFFETNEKDIIGGVETNFNLKGLVIGDLNSDGEKDYLVPYTESAPPGNFYSDSYAIYLSTNNILKYVGLFDVGGKGIPKIYLSYIKSGKVYGIWRDAFPPSEYSKQDKDVIYELHGSTLKKTN